MTGETPEQVVSLDHYQIQTESTAIYPDDLPDDIDGALVYAVLGLQGEAGELAEKLKKAIREDDREYLRDLEAELGDVLWYCARIAQERNTRLSQVANDNLDKLQDRADRGVIGGEGDDR